MPEISIPITLTTSATAIAKALTIVLGQKTCTAEEAIEEIRKDSIKTDNPKILYASIGTAEVTVLLARRYAEQILSHSDLPRISRIEVARLSDNTIYSLLEQELLPKEFQVRLRANLDRLMSLCVEYNIPYEEYTWPKLPIFHGFIYGSKGYIGRWTVGNTGRLSHDTQLHKLTVKKHADSINALRNAVFSSASHGGNGC
jgi:hypothetical protein